MRPRLNTGLFRKALAHIEAHPEKWNQSQWVSGSPLKPTMCFAARAYAIATNETLTNAGGLIIGNSRPIAETAAALLGLTQAQAERIFFYVRRRSVKSPELWTHVRFEDLCRRIEQVTGFRYQPGTDDAPA